MSETKGEKETLDNISKPAEKLKQSLKAENKTAGKPKQDAKVESPESKPAKEPKQDAKKTESSVSKTAEKPKQEAKEDSKSEAPMTSSNNEVADEELQPQRAESEDSELEGEFLLMETSNEVVLPTEHQQENDALQEILISFKEKNSKQEIEKQLLTS